MKKIGITGNIASGKSVVENIIETLGYKVIDADKICHNALNNNEEIIAKIKETFCGFNIVSDNKIDRKKLGEIVFNNIELKENLEKILHPFVKNEILKFFKENKEKNLVFASAALLFEANMQDIFDKTILVTADNELRLKRLMQRNNFSKKEAISRLNAQNPQEEKIKLADFVIENNNSLDELKFNIEKILNLLH